VSEIWINITIFLKNGVAQVGEKHVSHKIKFERGGNKQTVKIPINEKQFEKEKSKVCISEGYKKHFKIYEGRILQSLHQIGALNS